MHLLNGNWDARSAAALSAIDRLVYRSNLLGSELRITNTGGGNTSSKIIEHDPLTGRPVEVLWVKGSGGDLRTASRNNFASLELSKLHSLERVYLEAPLRGPKSEVEDRIVELYAHCTFGINVCSPSIDTPLHAFVPFRHVDHTHPISVIAVAASDRGPALTKEIYGDEVEWVDWQRPGFDLGLIIRDRIRKNPELRGIVLGKHGLISWADDDRECYELSIRLINMAAEAISKSGRVRSVFGGRRVKDLKESAAEGILCEIMPWIRGRLSATSRVIATVHRDQEVLDFVGSIDAPRLAAIGTSCPDHFLRTKIRPLFVPWNPGPSDVDELKSLLTQGLSDYRIEYRHYYEKHRHASSPPMRDPNPTVVLIPGVGMIAWGRSKNESRITAEFYRAAIEVMRAAEAIDRYTGLPGHEAFDIEYWQLEEAKLRRQPPEKELARQIIVIVGAGSGIGRAAAMKLAGEGSHLMCADVSLANAQETARAAAALHGRTMGDAGTGDSRCDACTSLAADMTCRSSLDGLMRRTVLAYGGIDAVVVTAGVYVAPGPDGEVSDQQWQTTFDVNVRGAYWVGREVARVWTNQNLTSSLVLATSVNAVVAKKGSTAYDLSKAAVNHLVRELAVELAPLTRVNGVAPAAVIGGSSMFPRERVVASLRKYNLPCPEAESTDDLRRRLEDFYSGRTLLKLPVRAEDQAEVIYFLVSARSARTTGQIITVDGGLADAFLR